MSPSGSDNPLIQTEPAPLLPPSLFACLPLVWSRLLFPGTVTEKTAWRWPAVLLLLVIPGMLLYPCLSFRLFEPDEGRYAEIPREMLLRGEWLVPYLGGEPYLDKPPLLYWLVVASYQILGVHDWSARLIPALAIHGCILLTYFLGKRWLGEMAAFWGAFALGLAPGFVSMGRLLVLDGLLAFWATLAGFAAFEAVRGARLHWGWWLTAAFSCGLGILTKGPVALVLLLPPLWAHRRLTGTRCLISWTARWAFAGVLALVVCPWYGAICLRMPTFAGYFLWQHNVVRFLVPFDHQRPVWFYGPIFLAGLLPLSLLAWPFARFLLSAEPEVRKHRSPELGLLLLSGCWCLLFFSLSGCKLPTYVLPAFPPLALALGFFLIKSRWRHSLFLYATSTGMLVLLAGTHFVVVPLYAQYHSPLGGEEEIARLDANRQTPMVCYPRNCDSVAFYLGRDDLHSYRSKATPQLLEYLQGQPRTVVLFMHRHSLQALREVLPPPLHLTGETALGSCPAPWANRLFSYLRGMTGEKRQELYYLAVTEQPCQTKVSQDDLSLQLPNCNR